MVVYIASFLFGFFATFFILLALGNLAGAAVTIITAVLTYWLIEYFFTHTLDFVLKGAKVSDTFVKSTFEKAVTFFKNFSFKKNKEQEVVALLTYA